jgi:uncharacterized protein (TIGR02453 family)
MPKVATKPTKSPKSSTKPPAFAGFSKSAPGFFHELAHEMNRDWFVANKDRYEREWVAPMTALLEQVHAAIAPAYKPTKLGAPKIMRIHRDVRFSKDKAPYKTHIGAVITVAGKKIGEGGTAAMYVHLGVSEEFVGVGTYMFDADKLAKWRKAVAGKPGAELAALVAKLRKAGYEVGGHDDYKKVPKPYAADHPRAALLVLRGLTAGPGEIPKGMLHDAKLAAWLAKHGKALAPLVKWLDKHVG